MYTEGTIFKKPAVPFLIPAVKNAFEYILLFIVLHIDFE